MTSTIPWLEKFRPRTLKNVVGNNETVERLKSIAKHGNVPNMIIAGPPGHGENHLHPLPCSRYAWSKIIYDSSFRVECFRLKVNLVQGSLSNNMLRGKEVVWNKIKMFAQQKINLPPGRHKIIILGNSFWCFCIQTFVFLEMKQTSKTHNSNLHSSQKRFLSMTKAAQQALRRTMEIYIATRHGLP